MNQAKAKGSLEQPKPERAGVTSQPTADPLVEVTVRYFAALKEQAGRDAEWVTGASPDARVLYAQLKKRYQFDLEMEQVRIAIDGAFARPETPLRSGQEIAFLPPVSGG